MRKEVPMMTNSWIEIVLECIGSAIVIALVAATVWLFCAMTSPQSSAEAEMELGGAAAMQDGCARTAEEGR